MQKPFKVEFFCGLLPTTVAMLKFIYSMGVIASVRQLLRFFEDKALDGEIALCNRITIGMSVTERIESKVFEVEHKGSIH